jgi:hypothetical protein
MKRKKKERERMRRLSLAAGVCVVMYIRWLLNSYRLTIENPHLFLSPVESLEKMYDRMEQDHKAVFRLYSLCALAFLLLVSGGIVTTNPEYI